jgi:hypothetical protein
MFETSIGHQPTTHGIPPKFKALRINRLKSITVRVSTTTGRFEMGCVTELVSADPPHALCLLDCHLYDSESMSAERTVLEEVEP